MHDYSFVKDIYTKIAYIFCFLDVFMHWEKNDHIE